LFSGFFPFKIGIFYFLFHPENEDRYAFDTMRGGSAGIEGKERSK